MEHATLAKWTEAEAIQKRPRQAHDTLPQHYYKQQLFVAR